MIETINIDKSYDEFKNSLDRIIEEIDSNAKILIISVEKMIIQCGKCCNARECMSPRIFHLALHGKNSRIRKKNIKRIMKFIKQR